MPFHVRRVVTGHDNTGRAVVKIDEQCKNPISRRKGQQGYVIWSSGEFPTDNSGDADGGARPVSTTDPNGTVFRIDEFAPGVAARNHSTDSIDYAIVLSGEIDMELDGSVVHLKAGDALVQRGTIHNWVNNGTAPCVIAFVLVAAKPAEAGGKVLRAEG